MENFLRSSEFWVALIAAIGVAGAKAGLWSTADFDQLIAPAMVYVSARVISKFAKKVGK